MVMIISHFICITVGTCMSSMVDYTDDEKIITAKSKCCAFILFKTQHHSSPIFHQFANIFASLVDHVATSDHYSNKY